MSGAVTVEDLLRQIGELRGGEHDLYKPGVAISYYEHDDCAYVAVTRCKDDPIYTQGRVVYSSPTMYGDDVVRRALERALRDLREGGAR